MENDKGTSMTLMQEALKYYGIKTAEIKIAQQFEYTEGTILPECCILGAQLLEYGHWSLYYKVNITTLNLDCWMNCPVKQN